MECGILAQVRAREFEQRRGRLKPLFLQVNESAGQLNQALVKIAVRSFLLRQPHFFKDIVRFVKELAVEAIEVSQVMGIKSLAAKSFNHRGDAWGLAAHRESILNSNS